MIVSDWLAYPSYSTVDDITSFQLSPGLYYTSRIEWAASAMEMSVIAARNVANLAAEYWDKEEGEVKQYRGETEGMKTEL